MDDLIEAMSALGWEYEAKTAGWKKVDDAGRVLWVSAEQAGRAITGAERGIKVEVAPVSRTVAAILAGGLANR